MVETMKEKIVEYSHCFNHSRENCNKSDSSLGFPKLKVILYDDFELSYLARSNLNDIIPLPNPEQESDPLYLYHLTLEPHLACTRASLMVS